MKAIGSRVMVYQTVSGTEVQIRALHNGPALVFLPVWLAGWTFGGVVAIGSFVHRPQPFLGFWLLGWLMGEVFAASVWSWMAFGREVLRVGEGVVTLGKRIGRFERARRFPLQEVSNVRAVGYFGSPMSFNASMQYWGLSGGTVAFDYQGKPVRFGVGLEESEARGVAESLAPFIRQAA